MILAPLMRLVEALPLRVTGWVFSILRTEEDRTMVCCWTISGLFSWFSRLSL